MKERTKSEGHQIICTNLPHYRFLRVVHFSFNDRYSL